MMLRQTILIREDLGFPRGLLAAQVAHLHMEYFRQLILQRGEECVTTSSGGGLRFPTSSELREWLKTPYTFVHGVPNREVLEHFKQKAQAAEVPYAEWSDTVYIDISETQREAFPAVVVGIAFAPTESDIIKTIIGDLPLLK